MSKVFERLAARSAPHRWGNVEVSRDRIIVRDFAEGREGDLRHELESAVLQENSDFGAGADQGAQLLPASSGQESTDEKMIPPFRGFGSSG